MLIILPLLYFILVFSAWLRRSPDPRSAFLLAAVTWGVTTTAITETLSLVNSLDVHWLALCWGAGSVCAALIVTKEKRAFEPVARPAFQWPSPLVLALCTVIVIIALLTGLIALISWPNDGDSLWYHLSRVAHWIQNRNVAFYPTNILPQLYYPPWSGYAMVQLILLGWDERLTNLIQWFSMLGSLVGVSLIAQQLGATPRGQLFSAFFCAALPMGILQAASTQNDYVTAFWLVCLVYALLALDAQPRGVVHTLAAGASLGLALLTKATAYVFVGPLLLFLFPTRTPFDVAGWLGRTALVALVALLLNVPQYARNFELFGSILGPVVDAPSAPSGQLNETISSSILASNLVRSAALHLGTPIPAVNAALEQVIIGWHAWIGIDVNDPRSTWRFPAFPFAIPPAPGNEATAGNPVHFLLIVVSVLAVASSRTWLRRPRVWRYALSLICAFMLVSLLFKWRPFLSHWHLPLFVLWSSVVGTVFQSHARLFAVTAMMMTCWALPFMVLSRSHPLIGAHSVLATDQILQSFRYNGANAAKFVGAAEFLRSRGCAEVGLLVNWNGLEYALWVVLPEMRAGRGRLEHVGVTNSSVLLESRRPPFVPCAVVAQYGPAVGTLEIGERTYHHAWSSGEVSVFLDSR